MEEKIKEIVSVFTKIPVSDIGPLTAVDRRAVKSSIILHRMFARLAEEGLVVENYSSIRTFSDLLGHRASTPSNGAASLPAVPSAVVTGSLNGGIGIDIEEVSSLPTTNDFRRDEFYTMNFTPSEIAYCSLQADPYASFAGLFSAKEAIYKVDGRHRGRPFNSMGIGHGERGEPIYPGFYLSISHAGGVAVAVAIPVKKEEEIAPLLTQLPVVPAKKQGKSALTFSVLALILAILAIILVIVR